MRRNTPPKAAVTGQTGLGTALRDARRAAGLTQASLAERIGIHRQKLIELEQGKPGVAIATYIAALAALGLELAVHPTRVQIDDYPQLKRLAWNRKAEWVSEPEALALYERNWHLVDEDEMSPEERGLLQILVARHGSGILHV